MVKPTKKIKMQTASPSVSAVPTPAPVQSLSTAIVESVPISKAIQPSRLLSVASEMYPFIKTGGLADVVGALPSALSDQGWSVTTLLPAYPAVMSKVTESTVVLELPYFFGGDAQILRATALGYDLFLLQAPHLFERAGNPYQDASGLDWQDNPVRYAALSLAAAMIGWGDVKGYAPDVVHVHDWQAALTPAYLHYLGHGKHRPKTVLTIHNLAFQGQFPASVFAHLHLPPEAYNMDGVEYYNCVGYLKAGINFADAITTVSPTYAHEICTPQGGMGLDGLLRKRGDAVVGILNGIDIEVWNPASDTYIPHHYDAAHLAQRAGNKRTLEQTFGLPESDAPLFCLISRLTWQKGIDLVIDSLDAIVGMGAGVVILGAGDRGLEAALYAAVARHPHHVAVRIGYDEQLSHLMQAGSDVILVPSRFEPCGLTQMYGLRYGCLPLVSQVGGLADTVIDANEAAVSAGVATGFVFHQLNPSGLQEMVAKAVHLYHHPDIWSRMQQFAMSFDVAWHKSAVQYHQLYQRILQH